jgi:L-serine kinase (ATP) / ParB family transcriptional regulator, heme-responsive regulator
MHLEYVDIDQICLHEKEDVPRLQKVMYSIREQGVLHESPVATLLADQRYLILDGVHRCLSLQELGCIRIPIQVVEMLACPLATWNHLVPIGSWIARLYDHPLFYWATEQEERVSIATISDSCENIVYIYPTKSKLPQNSPEWLHLWHQFADYYGPYGIERVMDVDFKMIPADHFLICYPFFDASIVLQWIEAGYTLPAGTTRFSIPQRAFHLPIPLSILQAKEASAVT